MQPACHWACDEVVCWLLVGCHAHGVDCPAQTASLVPSLATLCILQRSTMAGGMRGHCSFVSACAPPHDHHQALGFDEAYATAAAGLGPEPPRLAPATSGSKRGPSAAAAAAADPKQRKITTMFARMKQGASEAQGADA